MERILLEERLKALSLESGWPLDSVKSAWEALQQLPSDQRVFLTGERAAAVWDYAPAECLRFLLAGVRAGVFEQRWGVFSPASGWVLEQAESLDKLPGERLRDPFSDDWIEPDLDRNIFVTFSPLLSFFDDKPQPYEGSWEPYRLFTRAFPQDSDGEMVLADFKAFNPWELGKLELYGNNGDVFELISLEGRSRLTVRFIGQEKKTAESFIERMVQYKSAKANSSAQSFDVVLDVQGFSQNVLELRPGKGLFWLENRCGRKAAVMAWKQPVPRQRPQVASFLKGRQLINFPYFRQMALSQGVAEHFQVRMSGQSFLFIHLEAAARWDHCEDEAQVFHLLRQVQDTVVKASAGFDGFLFKRVSEIFYVTLPDPLAAVRLVVHLIPALGTLLAQRMLVKFALVQGSVLLIQNQGQWDFYGAALNRGLALVNQGSGEEIQLDQESFQSPGVEAYLTEQGLAGDSSDSSTGWKCRIALPDQKASPEQDPDVPFESL